jgi:hypothetical protein
MKMPESNRRHWITSLKAVSRNECGKISVASASAAKPPMMPTDQSFEPVIKTLPRTHFRATNSWTLVTVVTFGYTWRSRSGRRNSMAGAGHQKFLLI